MLLLLLAVIIVTLCLAKPDHAKIILTITAAILFFPIGVILALAKNYK